MEVGASCVLFPSSPGSYATRERKAHPSLYVLGGKDTANNTTKTWPPEGTGYESVTQWEIVAFGVVLGLHLYFEVFVLLVDLLFLSAILLRSSSVVPLTDTVRASNFD